MVYKFVLISDESDDFVREIHIDSEATFLEFHDAILKSVNYSNDQLTLFDICDDDWEKETEVTQIEMNTASDVDNYVMADTKLEELVSDEGQKLMFVFDMMNERAFYINLKSIITNKDLDEPVCKVSRGKAPVQIPADLFLDDATLNKKNSGFYDELDDFSEEGFNEDELGDLSINDNYFEEQ